MMIPSRREGFVRLALALISVGLCLGVVETVARIALKPRPIAAAGTPISRLSPTLGWTTAPGGHQRIQREDFDVEVSLNAAGLRGPDLPYEAASGKRRVAIVGDSFAHGYYAPEPESVTGVLREALRGCDVDVVNGGQPGYSTDQEWLFFSEEISKYRPAETVLLFYYNDLYFNTVARGTANRPKPLFEVGTTGELTLRPPEIEDDAATPPVTEALAPRFRGSALWAFAASRLQKARPDWQRSLAAKGLMPPLSAVPPQEFLPFGPRGEEERARVESMWSRTEAILREFSKTVRESGSSFRAFYVPARFEVQEEAWTYLRRRYEPDRAWVQDRVETRAKAMFDRLGIPFISATREFADAERDSSRRAYLPVDGHWNARGHGIAARSIAISLRSALHCE